MGLGTWTCEAENGQSRNKEPSTHKKMQRTESHLISYLSGQLAPPVAPAPGPSLGPLGSRFRASLCRRGDSCRSGRQSSTGRFGRLQITRIAQVWMRNTHFASSWPGLTNRQKAHRFEFVFLSAAPNSKEKHFWSGGRMNPPRAPSRGL